MYIVLYITNMAVAIILSFFIFSQSEYTIRFLGRALTDAYRNCLHINKTTKKLYLFIRLYFNKSCFLDI